ncbi:hypothetical protein GCM10011583_02070 [Streptomyces camponoticapitis]|uniref:Uncharacterized protein n=1 Tax=Streptomyces camponoticapitis TaxID=1616125 RepID=A0ABQ2DV98_9ACTN|nr:hypothetical protein [Streptomyces camponoticapitis]GGJ74265.1 hypothetical protein GCM10011583_02070 [Streptomyces camponoticapitis]
MFEYEMHQMRAAELISEADNRRLIRQVRKARKEAARNARDRGEGRVDSHRGRFARAA